MGRTGGRLLSPAAMLVVLSLSMPAAADMAACREIEDAEARLACFDALADDPERHQRGTDTEGAESRADRPDSRAERRVTTPPQDVRNARISELGTDAYGRLVITLEDGAIWRQVDDRRTTLSETDRVNIRQSAFGGWHMRDVGSRKRSIQVTRIDP